MASVPEIPVVHVPVRDRDAPSGPLASSSLTWAAVDVPRGRRPSPIALATLGTVAGVAAMALGVFAVIWAGRSEAPAVAESLSKSPSPLEARVLGLLAKPSTERIVLSGSGGRLLLAVGSGGRAAILIRGLPRRPAGKPYYAWVLRPGAAPIRAARFVGSERAVFLSIPVAAGTSVVVSTVRPTVQRPTRSGFSALRP